LLNVLLSLRHVNITNYRIRITPR